VFRRAKPASAALGAFWVRCSADSGAGTEEITTIAQAMSRIICAMENGMIAVWATVDGAGSGS